MEIIILKGNGETVAFEAMVVPAKKWGHARCDECGIKTINANIRLALREEGTIRDKWFCPECYEKFRGQILEFIERRSEFIEILLFDDEKGDYTIEDLSKEEFYRLVSELYEVHNVWELKFMDEVTNYKYK